MPKHLSIEREVKWSGAEPASRRSLIAGAGALLAGGSLAGTAWAKAAAKTGPAKSPNQAVVEATKRCESVGNTCVKHCERQARRGDNSLAECKRLVLIMLPVCMATNRLAQQDAEHLRDLAKVCADVCRDCEAECRKHESHHVECKRCAEACAETVKVLAAL